MNDKLDKIYNDRQDVFTKAFEIQKLILSLKKTLKFIMVQ